MRLGGLLLDKVHARVIGFFGGKMSTDHESGSEIENANRREAMSAILKYSAVVGGATATVLSASEAIAQSAASGAGYADVDPQDWRQGRRDAARWGDKEWEKWREWETWRAKKIEQWKRVERR